MAEPPASRKRKAREDKKPACDACRKRKVKCDGSLDYSRPCSRCARDQIKCIIPGERRMAIVDAEETLGQPDSTTISVGMSEDLRHSPSLGDSAPAARIQDFANLNLPQAPTLVAGMSPALRLGNSIASSNIGLAQYLPETRSRTIATLTVDGDTINQCFSRFNSHCLTLIPILSFPATPNDTYQELPLKFWVIVTIGSFRFKKNPQLRAKLCPLVENLAFSSLYMEQSSPHAKIEALLMMCIWHLSFDRPFFLTLYNLFPSTVSTMTLQVGLHRCVCLQELYPDKPVSDHDIIRGTKLWACAVIANQSAMAAMGLPVCDYPQSSHLLSDEKCTKSIPDSILLRVRLMAIVTKANRLITDLGLEQANKAQDRTLKTMLMGLETEIRAQQSRSALEGTLDTLHVSIAMLRVRSIALFLVDCDSSYTELGQAFDAAIDTIDKFSTLQDSHSITQHCPAYIYEAVVLAACVILKLVKSYPASTFNANEGVKSLFSAISLCSAHIALTEDDVPARVAKMLSGVWSHEAAFQDADGKHVQTLQVRNRLGVSVIFDCFCRWRHLYLVELRLSKKGLGQSHETASLPIAGNVSNGNTVDPTLNQDWYWTLDAWDLEFNPSM